MGAALGYNFEGFDFIYLKERAYVPQGHIDLAADQHHIRKGLLEMLWRSRPLMVANCALPNDTEAKPVSSSADLSAPTPIEPDKPASS